MLDELFDADDDVSDISWVDIRSSIESFNGEVILVFTIALLRTGILLLLLLFDWNVVRGEATVGKLEDVCDFEVCCETLVIGLDTCCLVGVMQGVLLLLLFIETDGIVIGGLMFELNWIDGDLSWLFAFGIPKLLGILDDDAGVDGVWLFVWFKWAWLVDGGGSCDGEDSFDVFNFVSFGRPNVES